MNYDILVVGSGTAGIYFAKRMAEQGLKTLVIDKASSEKLGNRLDIFHIDEELFDRFGVEKPKQGDSDYVSRFDYGLTRSALNNYEKKTIYPFIVMRFPLFLKRLISWAKSFGVEFSFETEFSDFIFEDNKIVGATTIKNGEQKDIKARLVVDASGIGSFARTKLPDGYGVENFEIGPRDKFYVILRYVKLQNPEKDRVDLSLGWSYYKSWIAPQINPDGAIIGIGANLSFEYAEKCYKKFTDVIELPPHTLERIEKGTTPYHRSPFSFVADGFLVLGDSACITKPYSGEGVTAAWVLCDIAAEEVGIAMQNGAYPTRESMWNVNVRYNHTQGADFANLMATLIGAINCTPEENDYEYKKDIIFSEKSMSKMNRNFNGDMSIGEMLNLVFKVFGGFITGKIRFATIKDLLPSVAIAGALKKHYKKFPDKVEDYETWVIKAEALWEKAGTMADVIKDM